MVKDTPKKAAAKEATAITATDENVEANDNISPEILDQLEVYTRDNVCVVKNGVIKPEDFPKITKAFLNYIFPGGAINETYSNSMQKKIKGYHAQYIINALNEVIWINCWREYGEMESGVPQGKSATVSIYKWVFEIGNWKNEVIEKTNEIYDPETWNLIKKEVIKENVVYFEVLARFETYGGSRNVDKWESLKGAKTNFLKKVCSFISNGWKSYALDLDEDFANQNIKDEAIKTPPAQKTPVSPKPTTPTAAVPDGDPGMANAAQPAAFATPKKLSDAQNKMIFALFNKLEPDDEKRKERINKALTNYNVTSAKDLSMTQAKHLIDKLLKMTWQNDEVWPDPSEQPVSEQPVSE